MTADALIIFFEEDKHKIENWIKITTLLTRLKLSKERKFRLPVNPEIAQFLHYPTTWYFSWNPLSGHNSSTQGKAEECIDDAKSCYSWILGTKLNNTWTCLNMLWMLLPWMVFPHWHNNTGTKNHNNSSDVIQLKLHIQSNVPFRETNTKKIWKITLALSKQIFCHLPDEEKIFNSTNCFHFPGWHTEPQRQKHIWKSVVLCTVTEQKKSHISPTINAPGISKRQATRNVLSITNTFSCTGRNKWFWWLVSAFQVWYCFHILAVKEQCYSI